MARTRGKQELLRAALLERLDAECEVRGRAQEIAESTGFSAAHISRVRNGKVKVGQLFADALMRYWGITEESLLRTDGKRKTRRDQLPNLRTALDFCRGAYPPKYLDHIEAEAQAFVHDRRRPEWVVWIEAKFWEWKEERRRRGVPKVPERSETRAWDGGEEEEDAKQRERRSVS